MKQSILHLRRKYVLHQKLKYQEVIIFVKFSEPWILLVFVCPS